MFPPLRRGDVPSLAARRCSLPCGAGQNFFLVPDDFKETEELQEEEARANVAATTNSDDEEEDDLHV